MKFTGFFMHKTEIEIFNNKHMEELLDKIAKLAQEAKHKIKCEKKDNRPITERVETFEDACRELRIPTILPVTHLTKREIALRKIEVIAKALNEGWEPNWDDNSEIKHRPWFIMSPSGFRFDHSDYARSFVPAGCGSHLHFKREALADYAGKQFTELYEQAML